MSNASPDNELSFATAIEASGATVSSAISNLPESSEMVNAAAMVINFPDRETRHRFAIQAQSEVELPSQAGKVAPETGFARGGKYGDIALRYLSEGDKATGEAKMRVVVDDELRFSPAQLDRNRKTLEAFVVRTLLSISE